MTLTPTKLTDTEKRIQQWLDEPFDENTKLKIEALQSNDPLELHDAFACDLEFGTGGMRARVGVGPNRMNSYTVRKASQGLALWLKDRYEDRPLSVVIAFDCRNHSRQFALDAASVLAAHGMHVYFLRELRPTPLLSFALRHFQAHAGIMITASHNPPDYNGFKVYGMDGGQLSHPEDQELIDYVQKVDYHNIPVVAENSPNIEWVGSELDRAYLKELEKAQSPNSPRLPLSIVFSNLHGTGGTLMGAALKRWGFERITQVDAQAQPDGNFPTVSSPNPEEISSLEMGIQKLLATSSDILLVTDPDADRLGVAVRHDGRAVHLSGQDIAVLMTEHILSTNTKEHPVVIKSLVTSQLIEKICQHYNAECINTLPGFKYISRYIHEWEKNSSKQFVLGLEESCGYLCDTFSRDKDGILSACVVARIAALTKAQGKTLIDKLYEIYEKYGTYKERLWTYRTFDTSSSLKDMVQQLCKNPPTQIGNLPVVECINMEQQSYLNIPFKSSLLILKLKNSQIIIRPSGTEPKIKVYLSSWAETQDTGLEDCNQRLNELQLSLRELFKNLNTHD